MHFVASIFFVFWFIELYAVLRCDCIGAGKTAFIGTLERALRGVPDITVAPHGAGEEGTLHLQSYLTEYFINFVDTRGLFMCDEREHEECKCIVEGYYKDGMFVSREERPVYDITRDGRAIPFSDLVHAIIWVVNGACWCCLE